MNCLVIICTLQFLIFMEPYAPPFHQAVWDTVEEDLNAFFYSIAKHVLGKVQDAG
jgi:hypothetical protein